VIYSFIITSFIVIILHHVQKSDDTDTKKHNKSLFVTGFFLFIVLLIGMHLLGIGASSSGTLGNFGKESTGGSGTDYEKHMLQNIHQSMHTGFAPF